MIKNSFVNIKMLIFDLDGTLFENSFYKKEYYEFALEYISKQQNITIEKAQNLFLDNNIYPYKSGSKSEPNNSITELFNKIGLNLEKWNNSRNLFFSNINFSKAEKISVKLLKKLAEKYVLILLTLNTKKTTLKILTDLSIDSNTFSEIITIETIGTSKNTTNKKSAFRQLSEKYALKYYEMISIGDRYIVDIKPLEELGGGGLLVQSPKDIEDFFMQ